MHLLKQTSPSKVAKKIQLISFTQAKAGKNLQAIPGDGVRVFSVMHISENSEREYAKGKKRARLFTQLR
jgi:hypothetical protein